MRSRCSSGHGTFLLFELWRELGFISGMERVGTVGGGAAAACVGRDCGFTEETVLRIAELIQAFGLSVAVLTSALGLSLLSRLSREGCSPQEGRPQIERSLASVLLETCRRPSQTEPRACGLRRSCQRASCEGPGAWSELQSRRAASFWSLVRSKRSSRSWSLHRASHRYRSIVSCTRERLLCPRLWC